MTVECRATQDALYECFEEEEMLAPDTEIQTGIVEYGLVSFVQNHIKQVSSPYRILMCRSIFKCTGPYCCIV